jgi:hypothetical protein
VGGEVGGAEDLAVVEDDGADGHWEQGTGYRVEGASLPSRIPASGARRNC